MLELLRGAAAFAAGPIIVHLATTTGGSPAAGIQIGVWVCFAIVVTGALVSLYVFILGRAKLQVPDIAHWEETGEPAWYSPPLAAGIRAAVSHNGDGNGLVDPSSRDAARVEAMARALQVAARRAESVDLLDASLEPVAAYLASLETDVREVAPGEWGLVLDAAGYVLNLGLAVRGPLLRAQAAVLPPGLIDPHQLLYWNRQAPLVCFAENQAGEVIVCGELPLQSLDAEMLDRFLGLLLASATRAREFAIQTA